MSEHTPGPWRENGEIVWSDYGEGNVVATLDDWRTSAADARLIAAAPDLLEVCQSACRVLTGASGHPELGVATVVDDLRKVIAKAAP